jgi:hypothetical protein
MAALHTEQLEFLLVHLAQHHTSENRVISLSVFPANCKHQYGMHNSAHTTFALSSTPIRTTDLDSIGLRFTMTPQSVFWSILILSGFHLSITVL